MVTTDKHLNEHLLFSSILHFKFTGIQETLHGTYHMTAKCACSIRILEEWYFDFEFISVEYAEHYRFGRI